MKQPDSLHQLARGASLIFIGLILSKVLGYIYRIIIARIGVDSYGLFYLAITIYSLFFTISLLGTKEGITKFIAQYNAMKEPGKVKWVIKRAFTVMVPFSIFLGILLFIYADFIANRIFNNGELSILLKILSFALPFNTLYFVSLEIMRALQRVRYEILTKNLFENILKIIMTLFLLFLGYQLIGIAIAYIAALIATSLLSFYLLKNKVFNFTDKNLKPINPHKSLFKYSFPLLIGGISISLLFWTDTLFLGYIKTTTEVGLYNAALPTAQLMSLATYCISFISVPLLTRIYNQKNKELFKKVYQTTARWVFSINLALLLALLIIPEYIINTIFGSEYSSVASTLSLLGVGLFIGYFLWRSVEILYVFDKTKYVLYNTVIAGILSIILNYILIFRYGVLGAALATGISFSVLGILNTIEAYYLSKNLPFTKIYFNVILAAIVAGAISFFIKRIFLFTPSLPNTIFLSLIILGFYVICLFLFRGYEKEDKELLIQEIRGFKNNHS